MLYSKVLIIDRNAKRYLSSVPLWEKYNIEPMCVENVTAALQATKMMQFQLIVLMEDKGSTEALNAVPLFRSLTNAPLVMSSDDDFDTAYKVQAFVAGCDEVWKTPKDLSEAAVKGHALIRRFLEYNEKIPKRTTVIINGDIILSTDYRLVIIQNNSIMLPRKEFEIFKMLITSPRRVFTYEQIYREVWGEEYADNANSILWGHIKSLRKKLRVSPDTPQLIKTAHGIGYSFDPEQYNKQI